MDNNQVLYDLFKCLTVCDDNVFDVIIVYGEVVWWFKTKFKWLERGLVKFLSFKPKKGGLDEWVWERDGEVRK